MTKQDFNLLNVFEQIEIINQKAVFLTERTEGKFQYKLYDLCGFYVEIEWFIEWNVQMRFSAFNTTEKIEPYLKNITLSL